MAAKRLPVLGLLALLVPNVQAGTVEDIRVWSESDKTRVVLDLDRPVEHNIFTLSRPDRLVIDLQQSRLARAIAALPENAGPIREIRSGLRADGQLRVVIDLTESVRSRSFTARPNGEFGDRIVIDLQPSGKIHAVKRASEAYTPGREIVIAIDPGHGGHDPGAIGKGRTQEKHVALAVSRELAARINTERGMRAVLIRNGDYYVDHRRRMKIARDSKADLFVSIHADAVSDRRANGATVYALSLKGASDEEARLLAERENAAVSVGGVSLDDKDVVLAEVLLDLSQNAALSASLDVGSHVIKSLASSVKVRRRSVQQAGLLVLKSPDMPSILVEMAYISNPTEERLLNDRQYQRKLANAVLAGVRSYFYTNPPPDTLIAAKVRRLPEGEIRHVIARGDTLSEIAERYNVSLTALRAANKLRNDRIRVGQTLAIPVFSGS